MRYKLTAASSNLLMFIGLLIIIPFLQFILLKPALEIGFKPDDWQLRFDYKLLGENPVTEIAEVWVRRGAHTAYQVYYIGLLESLGGFNYSFFQTVSIFFKILAHLAVFPLILIIFKKKLLAFLTTILYAASSSTVGPLEFALKGSDYAAIFWMCLFFISYYKLIEQKKINYFWLIGSLTLIILSLSFSIIRAYPLLIAPLMIELYWLFKMSNITNFKKSAIRLLVLYTPFILLVLYSPDSVLVFLRSFPQTVDKMIQGNWQMILSPFSGVGYTFITPAYWQTITGLLRTDNLINYTNFLLGGPTLLFGALTLLVAFLKSKRPLLFFIATLIINFLLDIILFFVIKHYESLPSDQIVNYDFQTFYPALFGIYILILGIVCFVESLGRAKHDVILTSLWVSSLFSFIFVFGTWMFAPTGISFSSTNYYLVVASLGTSLFIASFLCLIYDLKERFKLPATKYIGLFSFFLILTLHLIMNAQEIHKFFQYLLRNGAFAQDQQKIQSNFKKLINGANLEKPLLIYIDTSEAGDDMRFLTESFSTAFPFWMHFDGNILIDGCVEIFTGSPPQLKQLVQQREGQKGLAYRGLCVEKGRSLYKNIFYKEENFYAFRFKSREFINIKNEILRELSL